MSTNRKLVSLNAMELSIILTALYKEKSENENAVSWIINSKRDDLKEKLNKVLEELK